MKASKSFGISLAIGVALVLLLVGCTAKSSPPPSAQQAPSAQGDAWQKVVAAAKKEAKVSIYDPAYFGGALGQLVAKTFGEKYGITLDIQGLPPQTITEKLQTEKRIGQFVADLALSGSVSSVRLVKLDLAQDVSGDLPVLRDRTVFTLPPVWGESGDLLVFQWSASSLVVNTQLVKPGEIQSYWDLLQPKWKGKIIIVDPRTGGGMPITTVTNMRMDKILSDDYFYQLGKHEPSLWAGSNLEPNKMVARGEFAVNWEATPQIYLPVLKEGAPIRILNMKEGSIAIPSTLIPIRNAPHPNALRLFLDWFLSAEGQRIYHEAAGSTSLRKDVPDFMYAKAIEDPIKKLLPTTYTHAVKTIEEVNEGVMEKFFGKR